MSFDKLILCCALLLSTTLLSAAPVELNQNHPETYVVKKGDTLWDIAAMFLRDPWRWPDIWQANQQIANPHWIYPGDVLELAFIDGRPVLRRQANGVIRLSPKVRVSPMGNAIPSIPLDVIAPFLSRPHVLEKDEGHAAPYVVAVGDEHLLGSAGMRFYVRNLQAGDDTDARFDIVRPGKAYRDADSNEVLGYEADFIGTGVKLRDGDPATFRMRTSKLEMLKGDRLVRSSDTALGAFYPKAPDTPVDGSIIDVYQGVSEIGQFQIVALDRGSADGLAPGDVLEVLHRGDTVRDTVGGSQFSKVKLPDERAGALMVFRTYERLSFGLIMSATRALHVLDRVRSPQ